jgi:SepF-like predicted cell division protein (DUF552 family)
MVLDKIKRAFSGSNGESEEKEYLEIDVTQKEPENKISISLFSLKQYEDVTEILNALREGYTIAVIDIKLLRQKDSIELKRAVSKIKKTIDALEGTIVGFGENIVIVAPSFAKINKEISLPSKKKGNFDF